MPRSRAEALLEWTTASPMLDVTGDLARGFAWQTPGAVPRRSHVVIPLAAPVWPSGCRQTMVFIELWWARDEQGYRRVRSFLGYVADPCEAYQVACCLWSTCTTGAGATAAFLYGPDRQVVFRIQEAAKTCSQTPADAVLRFTATANDRDTTDLPPDHHVRSSAVHDERINRVLTYAGSRTEIVERLREHAEQMEKSRDPLRAMAMRRAADQIEAGTSDSFKDRAHYLVEEPDSGPS
ncbi:hypothetical protein GCM10009839_30260 [Catenulispora yoronensis]|uniref:Uncharacterized protein n=1 Tax=Catenulispora yoronensis TaxID=450799 RepID=A0ABP5FPC8_9ACTN